jgi:hypothetical protein
MLPFPWAQLCRFLRLWSGVKGAAKNDNRGQEALLREAHGLLSVLEGRFTERQEDEMGHVEFSLGFCLWTAGRGAEGEPLLRNFLRRRSGSVFLRVQAVEYLADMALQRGEVTEAARLCDEALALTGETPDAFKVLHPNTDPARMMAWVELHVEVLALRGSVEERRGDLSGAGRYDDRGVELVKKYGGSFPVDSHRRLVLRQPRGAVRPLIQEIATLRNRYVQQFGDHGLILFDRSRLEAWVRALRDCAAALLTLRAGDEWESGRKLAEAMEGEAAEIEGVFDALKAAALAEARAAVAQERASRQQAAPARLTKSQKKRARQKAARAAFVAGGEASAAAPDAAAAVGEEEGHKEGHEEGHEEEQEQNQGHASP